MVTRRLQKLLENFPAVAVVGARQVGKSTLLQHHLQGEASFVLLDPLHDIQSARAEPDLFLDAHPTPLVLDEIQYAPELVSALKRRIDRDRRPGLYVLTGSQQWEVMRDLSESLAGRVVFLDLEAFSLAEIAATVDETRAQKSWLELWLESPEALLDAKPKRLPEGRPLYERLWRGMLPEVEVLSPEVVPDFHLAYQRTYVERDARLFGDVRDWELFARFFRLVAALTAQEVNRSQLGRELGITPQTAGRWIDMLTATFQWHEVPAWSGNTVKRIAKKAKGFMSDSGTVCSALRITSPHALADHPAKGAIFETAVAAELRKLISAMPAGPLMHHWRTQAGAEVDLVLERDGILFPIEIKSTANPSKRDLRGFKQLRETYPQQRIAPGIVLAPTESVIRYSTGDVALPWDLDLFDG